MEGNITWLIKASDSNRNRTLSLCHVNTCVFVVSEANR